MHIVQISDTHLIHTGGTTNENFSRFVAFVNRELRPDLVVNTGDLVALSPDEPEDRAVAATLHQAFDAPVLTLPGNHDVGEVGDEPWMGITATSARVAAHRESFGEDRWLRIVDDGWALLGLNSEVLGSGLPEEDEQWRWLERALPEAGDRSILLFLHKPLFPALPDGATGGHAINVGAEDRERLLGVVGAARLRGVGSGHLHHYRRTRRDGTLEVWAPSTAFVPELERTPLTFGLGQLGVVEYRAEGGTLGAWFRSIPGVTELDYTEIPQVRALLDRIAAESTATA